jgi:hypothetical protein
MTKQTTKRSRKVDTYRDWDMSGELISTFEITERKYREALEWLDSRKLLPTLS